MNQKAYLKNFARHASLSVFGTLGVSCYILADTFFIAKGLGTNGLAALNIAIPVFNFISGCGLMLGMGGATWFSICKSSGDAEKSNDIFSNTVYLAILFGVLFLTAGLFFAEPLAVLLGAEPEILPMTATYLKYLLLFAPAFLVNNLLLCFVRNDNAPLLAAVAMLVGSFANILLDYIFIFPMQMGIFGAVFATCLSPVISVLVMLLHFIKKKNSFRLIKTGLQKKIICQDFSLGFPSLIAQVASGVAMIIFNMLILKLEGNTGIAAYGVTANISLVVVGIYTGIAHGVQPLLSRSYGSGNKKEIQMGLRCSMITMLLFSIGIYWFIFVFAGPITMLFNSENNQRMQEISVTGLKLYFSSVAFVGFNTMMATFFTSVEKALQAHILSLLRGLVLLAPMAFLLSAVWKMNGIWLTYPVTEGMVAVLGAVIYLYEEKNSGWLVHKAACKEGSA